MSKKYNTPHRTHPIKSMLTEEEYSEFARRCDTYQMSQAEVIRQAISGVTNIISFDPRDGTENGLTLDRAQELGINYCREHFPGHQALVCTHPDGHNQSGNIHVLIVINSLRIEDVPFLPYMDRPCDTHAGMKHRCTAAALRYFRSEVMEITVL